MESKSGEVFCKKCHYHGPETKVCPDCGGDELEPYRPKKPKHKSERKLAAP